MFWAKYSFFKDLDPLGNEAFVLKCGVHVIFGEGKTQPQVHNMWAQIILKICLRCIILQLRIGMWDRDLTW